MRGIISGIVNRSAILAASALLLMVQPTPAAAVVRTTLSFFSPNDIRQGQVGATGTYFDSASGTFELAGSRSCCLAVSAAPTTGPSFDARRTFNNLDTVSQIYFMGVTTVASQDHLVIALNTAFSATLVGREFGTAFAGFSETQIIADLFGQFDQSMTVDQRIAAGNRLGQFQDALFGMNAGFGVADNFSLTSFSIGTPAGRGFSTPVAANVPEPATWGMTILGFGLIGGAVRRRTRAAAFA